MDTTNNQSGSKIILRIARGNMLFVHPCGSKDSIEASSMSYPLNGSMSVAANLRSALNKRTEFIGNADSVTVLLDSPLMLLPIEEFCDDEADALFRYSFTSTETMAVATRVMPSENVVALFGVNKDLNRVLNDNFTEVNINPLMQSMWRHLHRCSFTGTSVKLYAYFHEKKMEVCSFRHSHVRYQNSFKPNSAANALYYLMGVWSSLGLKNTSDELIIIGQWPYADELTAQAKRFVSHVYLWRSIIDFKIPSRLDVDTLPLDLQAYLNYEL